MVSNASRRSVKREDVRTDKSLRSNRGVQFALLVAPVPDISEESISVRQMVSGALETAPRVRAAQSTAAALPSMKPDRRKQTMKQMTIVLVALCSLVLVACGGSGSDGQPAGSVDQPTSTGPTVMAESPAAAAATDTPATNTQASTGASATVPCEQLLPADNATLLLGVEPARSDEVANPGSTTCTWQYTPKNATQPREFQIEAGQGEGAVQAWQGARPAELANEPADIVVNSIDGLADESYIWKSTADGVDTWVVYGREGDKTLVMRFGSDVLFLGNQSGIIDYAQRFFSRM